MTTERAHEAEMAVLGSMMIDSVGLIEGRQSVVESDFGHNPHRLVFNAILACADQGVVPDIVTVRAKLRERGALEEIEADGSVVRFIDSVVCSDNVVHYAKIVRAASLERKLDDHINELWADKSDENITELKRLRAELDAIYQPTVFSFRHDLDAAIKEITTSRPAIISTGFPSLDKVLGGSEPGDLIVIGARTGGGKTAIMVKMLLNMADGGVSGLYMTTEMSAQQIVTRVLPAASGVKAWKFRERRFSARDLESIHGDAASGLKKLPINIYGKPRIGISDIRAIAKEVKPRVIFFDYLQRAVLPEGSNRAYQVMEFMAELKTFAMETGTVVIVGCQLARGLDKTGSGEPTNADLKDSGSIEAESDSVILMWKKSPKEVADMGVAPTDDHTHISALVSKNRHGRAGLVSNLILNGPFVDMLDTVEMKDEAEIPF